MKCIQVKTNTDAHWGAPAFPLHLEVCKHMVIVTLLFDIFGTREGYYVCHVDAGFKVLLNQDCNGRNHCNTIGYF